MTENTTEKKRRIVLPFELNIAKSGRVYMIVLPSALNELWAKHHGKKIRVLLELDDADQ